MDYTQLILFILGAAKEIYDRHQNQPGTVLTDEMVAAEVNAQLTSGQNQIAAWFVSKGLPPPE